MLDVIDDTFGEVDDALGRVRARMICSSHGQGSSDEIDVPLNGAILALYLEIDGRSDRLSDRSSYHILLQNETYILGPLTDSVPKDGSGGKIDTSSHVLLKLSLAFQLLGVDEGAGGYATDEVAATDDVTAACRGSSLPCRRRTYSSSFLPKSSVIEVNVLFHGTLVIERTMT